MANFEPKKLDLEDINGGIRFTESDGVTPNAINDPIEAVAYAQTVVEHLTDTPDNSEINGVGSPNVSFVSNTTADGVTIHKFKFSNLSGATFTPSLDEAGNLSWSNNRNLPNPPTINISGRDYLFSSEVLSGTYIPQVNSEVTDMPLTSFNRAPVDDIDHCYLFYYYTPENIYYWLATQVVDIQETTAALKILSVVRLTGYTPTIGENGNWVINGEDTGKPSYGASGVTDVVAGASYNQDDFTITPLTFNFEVGNSKTVNVKAAVGNVEDGSYAKLAQVVRTDTAQSLTDEQKTQAQNNMGLDNKYAKQSGSYPNLTVGKATNADNATNATKAEQDADGNRFSTSYAKKADLASGFAIGTQFDGQNITANCTLVRCSGSIVIASGVTVNAIDSPSLTATGSGTLLRNGYAIGDFFIGEYSPAARAGGEWTAIAAGHTLVGSGIGSGYPVGATGGYETVTLTIEQIPNHSHEIVAQKNGVTQEYKYVAASTSGNVVYLGTAGAGGGQAHTNMPPYYVTNLWRRTA